MTSPIAQLVAHLCGNTPYFTLGHDMDSMYSVQLCAYSGTDEMEWQATITTEEARTLVYQAARLHDSEGEAMRTTDFLALLTRLDTGWAAMQAQPSTPTVLSLGDVVSKLVHATQTQSTVKVSIDGEDYYIQG